MSVDKRHNEPKRVRLLSREGCPWIEEEEGSRWSSRFEQLGKKREELSSYKNEIKSTRWYVSPSLPSSILSSLLGWKSGEMSRGRRRRPSIGGKEISIPVSSYASEFLEFLLRSESRLLLDSICTSIPWLLQSEIAAAGLETNSKLIATRPPA